MFKGKESWTSHAVEEKILRKKKKKEKKCIVRELGLELWFQSR